MATLAQQSVTLLRKARVKLDPGLDQAEMSAVEEKYGISFGDDHRALLSLAVPVSKKDVHVSNKWVDWRRGEETEIRWRLAQPLDGAVFDVFHNDFWPASWGPRPVVDDDELEAQARHHMARWPKLIRSTVTDTCLPPPHRWAPPCSPSCRPTSSTTARTSSTTSITSWVLKANSSAVNRATATRRGPTS